MILPAPKTALHFGTITEADNVQPEPSPPRLSPMNTAAAGDPIAALASVIIALVFSLLPFVLWWRSIDAWAYIADKDNQYYLQLAAQAFYFHPSYISDPAYINGISPFPWIQFVPAAALARILGIGAIGVNLLWSVFAAIGIALGFYLVFRQFLRVPWVAAACTILLVESTDPRMAQPLVRQIVDFVRVSSGHPDGLFTYNTVLFPQFRVVHPGLTLPFLMMLAGLVAWARERPNLQRIVPAGLALGLLFYVSFYVWTAALLALGLVGVLDREHLRAYLHIAWIGVLTGLPALLSGMHTRALAIGLPRISLFLHITRLSYVEIPKGEILLLVVTGAWILMRARRDLWYLWSIAFAAFLLLNHHLITGLQLHNSHWTYIAGPILIALLLVMAATEAMVRVKPNARVRLVCAAFLIVYGAMGLYLRAAEAMSTREGVTIRHAYRDYRVQRDSLTAKRLVSGAVIAGDVEFCELAAIVEEQHPLAGYAALQSAPMSDDEWESRAALNAYLEGEGRTSFVRYANNLASVYQWGPWSADEIPRSALAAALIAHYDTISRDSAAALDRFDVRYLALPIGKPVPRYLTNGWSAIQNGPFWSIWERSSPVGRLIRQSIHRGNVRQLIKG